MYQGDMAAKLAQSPQTQSVGYSPAPPPPMNHILARLERIETQISEMLNQLEGIKNRLSNLEQIVGL